MEHLVRLRQGELTDAELLLLDSAGEDAPAPGAEEECLAAFGVGVGSAIGGATAAHLTRKLALGVRAATGAGAKAGISAAWIAKWVGIGAAIGTVVAGGAVATTAALAPPATGPREGTSTAAPRLPGPRASRSEARGAEPPPESEASRGLAQRRFPDVAFRRSPGAPEPPSRDVPSDFSEPPGRAEAPPAAASSVALEVASLDAARAALGAGDSRAALARLDAHERRFPNGELEPEAVVLRVRALRELGEWEEAARVANAFIGSHPRSAQVPRLRALISR